MKNIVFLLTLFVSISAFSQGNRFGELYLTSKPPRKDTANQVLVRDPSTNRVMFRNASTLGVSFSGLTTNRILYYDGTGLANGPSWDPTNLRIGIGFTTPHAQIQLSNSISLRKIVMFELADNDHQFHGFGLNSAELGYHVPNTSSDHIFYAGASSSSSNSLFKILGSGIVQIPTTPTNDNSNTAVLTRDGSGNIETRAASTLITAPAGSDTEIQYNNSGAFGSSGNLRYSSGTFLLGSTSSYSVTNELAQITKRHATYSGIEDILTMHVAGSTFGSVTNGFGGQLKLGLAGTVGTVGRTGIFAHSWVTVNSLSKVRVGQVVGSSADAVIDFVSNGNFDFYSNAVKTLNIDPNGHIVATNPLYLYGSGTSNANVIIGSNIELTPVSGSNVIVNTGVSNNGNGLKHARVTTGSITALTSTTVTVTWPTPFSDTNYTVVGPTIVEATGSLIVLDVTAKTASSVTVYIRNTDTTLSRTGEIHIMAIHD